MKRRTNILLLLVCFSINFTFSQTAFLDTTFGIAGQVLTPFEEGGLAYDMAVQDDGKILVGGYIGAEGFFDPDEIAVVRYLPDGSLDNSFGLDGIARTVANNSSGIIYSLALQPDGKILIAGFVSSGNTVTDMVVARFNEDGLLDTSFGNAGTLTLDFFNDLNVCTSIGLTDDGKIILAGYSSTSSSGHDFVLVRLTSTGEMDMSFGNNGWLHTDFSGQTEFGLSLAIQADGNLLLGGYTSTLTGDIFAMARYLPDGDLDTSFGVDGKVRTRWTGGGAKGENIAIQADGKILLGGLVSTANDEGDFGIARYNTDGSLDGSFGVVGKVITKISTYKDKLNALTIEEDGKIIAAGYTSNDAGFRDFALVRYLPDGSIDTSFGNEGKIRTDFEDQSDAAWAIKVLEDNKIVVAGYSTGLNGGYVLARYLSELSVGTVDFASANNLLIYPNPIVESFTLEYTLDQEEELQIDLYDLSGKLIQGQLLRANRNAGTHQEYLHLNRALPRGNYILTLSNGKGQMALRITK